MPVSKQEVGLIESHRLTFLFFVIRLLCDCRPAFGRGKTQWSGRVAADAQCINPNVLDMSAGLFESPALIFGFLQEDYVIKDMFFTIRLTAEDRKRLDELAAALGQRKGKTLRFLIEEATRCIPASKEDRNAQPEQR
jgi:hypothetical protein